MDEHGQPPVFIQIRNIEDCVGKTVEAVCDGCGDSFGFRFTDRTYFYCCLDCDETSDAEVSSCYPPDDIDARALGILTEEEYQRQRVQERAESEAKNRAEYERLRAMFEGKPGG